MTEKLGIENLKIGIVAVINLGERIEKGLNDDGKITFAESLGIGTASFPDFIKVVKNGRKIKDEFLDLDADEKIELVNFVKSELDLINDKVEEIIEKALDVIVSLDTMIKLF